MTRENSAVVHIREWIWAGCALIVELVWAGCGVGGWHVLAEFTGRKSKTGSHVEAGSMYKFYRCGISAQLHRRGGKSVKSAQHH